MPPRIATRSATVSARSPGAALSAWSSMVSASRMPPVAREAIEQGTVLGIGGRVLDNRRTLVVERGFHPDRDAAGRRADGSGAARLHSGRVFILPTRTGLGFGVLLLVMFLGAVGVAYIVTDANTNLRADNQQLREDLGLT